MKLPRTMTTSPFALSLIALAVLAGCSSVPDANPRLDEARSAYRTAQATPQTRDGAPVEMKLAGDALARANEAYARSEDAAKVDHLAYLARQRVALAQEAGGRKAAEASVAQASADRDQLRLAARTREADAALRSAQSSQLDARAAQIQAQSAERDARASQSRAEASQQQASAAQRSASDAQQRAALLESQLRDLNARKTERGMVITVGDVLFDTGRAELKSGGLRSMDKLVSFLKEHPQRTAMVEGFTDSVGSEEFNQALSARRADSVRTALVSRGVQANRIATQGYGEDFPVAGNESSGGRQMNRRVEIVLSDDGGVVTPR